VDARSRGQAVLRAADWPPRLYLIGLPVDAAAQVRLGDRTIGLTAGGRHVRALDLPADAPGDALHISWE
jgi:hypothetical protein